MPALMLMLSHSTMLVIAIGARLLGLIFIVSIVTLSGVTQSGYYMNGPYLLCVIELIVMIYEFGGSDYY